MSFTDGFFRLNVNVSNTERGVYQEIDFKLCKHPLETPERLVTRILAYCWCYQDGIKVTPDLHTAEEPALYAEDYDGSLKLFAFLGVPTMKRLQRNLRAHQHAEKFLFLYDQGQKAELANHLRGAKSNWVDELEVLSFSPELIEFLCGQVRPRLSMDITVVGSEIFISNNDFSFECEIERVDLWQEFQKAVQ